MASSSISSRSSSKRPCVCLLDYFNEHLLLQVLERIPDVLDRRSFRLVCRSFWVSECVSRKRVRLLRAALLERILRRYEKLEELDLSLCPGVFDEHLARVGEISNSRLRVVNLTRLMSFTNAGLVDLTSKCSSLVELDVSYCSNVGDPGLAALALPNKLESLSLTGCFGVSNAGLEFIASGCSRLKVLVLKGCVAITDAGLKCATSRCKEITYLDLSFTEISDDGVGHITGLQSLISLKLTACNNVGDKSLEHLRTRVQSLEELDVARCQGITLAGMRTLPALSYLNISHCIQITEEALMNVQWPSTLQAVKVDAMEITGGFLHRVAVGCNRLRELSISKTRGVTDTLIAPIITECKQIAKLNFTCCFELTSATLVSISRHCPGLKSLKMESSFMVTDSALIQVLRNCPLLEELDVTDCSVSDEGLRSVGNCRYLKVLKLAFCHTTNAGISLLGSCSNLSELDLYRCRLVGDPGVASIVRGCENLQVLNLSYCSRITDASMECIARLSKLYQLEIRGCNLITSNGLKQVAAGCKRLVELDIKRCTRIEDSGLLALEHLCPGLRQINVSYCPLSNDGLMALARLGCMQNMKLVHLRNVSMECFGDALLNCGSLKKVKLLSHIKFCLPSGVVEQLESRGCRLRWMNKPDVYD